MVVNSYNPSYSGSWGRIAWTGTWKAEVAVSRHCTTAAAETALQPGLQSKTPAQKKPHKKQNKTKPKINEKPSSSRMRGAWILLRCRPMRSEARWSQPCQISHTVTFAKAVSYTETCIQVYIAELFITAKRWKQLKMLNIYWINKLWST